MSEVTYQELSDEFNIPVDTLAQWKRRGYLPAPIRSEGRKLFFPAVETKLILSAHVNGKHWVSNKPRAKRKPLEFPTPVLTWDDVR